MAARPTQLRLQRASVFLNAVARILPTNAVWYASNHERHPSDGGRDPVAAGGGRAPSGIQQDAAFAEQNMGEYRQEPQSRGFQ